MRRRALCLQIGSQGDGREEFDEPTTIAVNGNGVIFVTDTKNDRIQVLDSDGFLGTFGEFGEDDGQFLRPVGIAVNSATGEIYVTDADRHRVQKFAVNTEFVATVGTFGSGQQSFNAPLGPAIDPQTNQLFVADTNNDRIARYNGNLFFLDVFGSTGGGDGQFREPSGLAIDAQRNVVIADTGNNRVQVVDQDGNFVRAFGRQGSGLGEFDNPSGIAIDRDGFLAVVDTDNHRLQHFVPADQLTGNTLPNRQTGKGEEKSGKESESTKNRSRH